MCIRDRTGICHPQHRRHVDVDMPDAAEAVLYLHEGFRKVEVVFVEGKKVANGYKNQPKKEMCIRDSG